jgi:outer membrane receptor protein involved in Fe transport
MAYPTFVTTMFRMLFFLLFIVATAAEAADNRHTAPSEQESPWSFSLRSGFIHQLDTDLDKHGGFSINRFFVQGGPVYSPGYRRSVALEIGYGFDGYDFSGKSFFSNHSPWKDIHTLQLGAPIRRGMDNGWSVFILPSLRVSAESDAHLDDALTAGAFAGAAYRFSDRLTIGPGMGIMSRLEDNAAIFPLLLIEWKITTRMSLSTGQSALATQGPGIALDWEVTDRWHLLLGGRYDKQRFRLEDKGVVPSGIGENTSFPLYAGASCRISRKVRANFVGGVELGGELRLEDRDGRLIAEDDYDPAVFLGVTVAGRF